MTWNRRRLAAACLAAAVLAGLAVAAGHRPQPHRAAVRAPAPGATKPGATAPGVTAPGATAPGATGPVRTLRIMPLGDSITYGVGSRDHGGYRIDLGRRLAAAGLAVTFVGSQHAGPAGSGDANEGHSGWTITQLTTHVTGWLRAARPDLVLLHTGTNDMGTVRRAELAPARLALLLDRITRACPHAQVFVAEIVGSAHPVTQRRIDRYNAALARLVTRRGGNLHLVDQRVVTAGLLRDGLHPDDSGYRRMAATWAAAIRAVPAGWSTGVAG